MYGVQLRCHDAEVVANSMSKPLKNVGVAACFRAFVFKNHVIVDDITVRFKVLQTFTKRSVKPLRNLEVYTNISGSVLNNVVSNLDQV